MLRIILPALLLCSSVLAQTVPARQFLLRIEPVRKDFTLQTMSEEERPILDQHVAYLNSFFTAGTMTLAGQAFDPKGLFGIIIVNAADAQAATDILNGDPAVKSKFFRGEVIPFRTVFLRTCAAAAPPAAK
jgi:uncharacterized protein YciI